MADDVPALLVLYYTDLHFLVKWCEDEEQLYDVLPSRDVRLPDGVNPEDSTQVICEAKYKGSFFPVQVLSSGIL